MAETTLKLPFERYVRQVTNGTSSSKYSYMAMQSANAGALTSATWHAASCDYADVQNTVNQLTRTDGVWDDTEGAWTTRPTYTAWIDDKYDAYKQAGDLVRTNATMCGYAGCVAYRFKLPSSYASSATANLSNVAVAISRDRYCRSGVRVALHLSNTSTPSDDWSVIRGEASGTFRTRYDESTSPGVSRWGFLGQTGVGNLLDGRATYGVAIFDATTAPAYSSTSTYSVGDRVLVDTRMLACVAAITTPHAFDEADWEPVDDHVHVSALATATRYAFAWVYITLEDYTDYWDYYSRTEARNYYIEGSAMLVDAATSVTFADTVTADIVSERIYRVATEPTYPSIAGDATPNMYWAATTHNGDVLQMGGLAGAIAEIIEAGGVIKYVMPTGRPEEPRLFAICGSGFSGTFADMPGLLFYDNDGGSALHSDDVLGIDDTVTTKLLNGSAHCCGLVHLGESGRTLPLKFMPCVYDEAGGDAGIPMPFGNGTKTYFEIGVGETVTVDVKTTEDVYGHELRLVVPSGCDRVIPCYRNHVAIGNVAVYALSYNVAVGKKDANGYRTIYRAGRMAYDSDTSTYYSAYIRESENEASFGYDFQPDGYTLTNQNVDNISIDYPRVWQCTAGGVTTNERSTLSIVCTNPNGQSTRLFSHVEITGQRLTPTFATPYAGEVSINDTSATGANKLTTPQLGATEQTKCYLTCGTEADGVPIRREGTSDVRTGYIAFSKLLFEDVSKSHAVGLAPDENSHQCASVQPRLANRSSGGGVAWTLADAGQKALKGAFFANGLEGFRESGKQNGLMFAITKREDRRYPGGEQCGVFQVVASPLVFPVGMPTAYDAKTVRISWSADQLAHVTADAVVHAYIVRGRFSTSHEALASAAIWAGDTVTGLDKLGDFKPSAITPTAGVYSVDLKIENAVTDKFATIILTASVNMDAVNMMSSGASSFPCGIGTASISLSGEGKAAAITTGFSPDVTLVG